MKNLLSIILILTVSILATPKQKITLDTGGHLLAVSSIQVTNDRDIISVSQDKVIRVWDTFNKKLKRTILGEVGEDKKGNIKSIALSPNERFLVVGVLFNNDFDDNNLYGDIRVYDYQSGKIVKILHAHHKSVHNLAFSNDGKFFISGEKSHNVKIWRVRDFTLVDSINLSNDIYGVKIIKKENNYFAIVIGLDNKIIMYDMQTKKIIKTKNTKDEPYALAISNKYIVTSELTKEIQVYDYDLNSIKTIKLDNRISEIAFSPNGRFLVAKSNKEEYIFDMETLKKVQTCNEVSSIANVYFLDNDNAISLGWNGKIYIWDISSGEVIIILEGDEYKVYNIGIKGNNIGWTKKLRTKLSEYVKPKWSINLKNFKIKELSNLESQEFKEPLVKYKNYSLEYDNTNGLKLSRFNIKKDGKIISHRDSVGYFIYFGFYKNYIVSASTYGIISFYSFEGKEILSLDDDYDGIFSIAIDGNRLVSSHISGKINIWDLSKLKRDMKPMCSLFVSKYNEWIIWNSKGYYLSSKNGAKYLGFHINQGLNKEAKFIPITKYPNLNRPDIIKKILGSNNK